MSEQTRDAQWHLESLTPGGSEFVNNPERCAAWVRERLDSAQRLTVRAYMERNETRAENARLREALEGLLPFAEEHVNLSYRDADVPIVMDDIVLRTARAALAPVAEGEGA